MNSENNQPNIQGNGVPPLGFSGNSQEKTVEEKKGLGKWKLPVLIGGGILMVGGVLGVGYKLLVQKPRIAEVKSNWYFCVGTSASSCQYLNAGDKCKNKDGVCKVSKVVREYNGGATPGDAVCVCELNKKDTNNCNQGVNHGCGAAPDKIPQYNKTAEIGPFEKDGKLVVYFYPLDTSNDKVKEILVDYEGQTYEIPIEESGKQRIVTDITVKTGTTATLTKVLEVEQSSECAPKQPTPPQGTGWIPVNSDQTCGSGLPGPPQGGKCTPFKKPSVEEAISWAESFGDQILSKECWADWREWPGDYDFNDYFIMIGIEATEVSCESLSKDKENIVIGDKVKFICEGKASSEEALKYEFRYRIDGGDYQSLEADGNEAVLTVTKAGDYQVQCRACLADGSICSDQWSTADITESQ